MKIINIKYNISEIKYTVKYKNRPNKIIDLRIHNLMCFNFINILKVNNSKNYLVENIYSVFGYNPIEYKVLDKKGLSLKRKLLLPSLLIFLISLIIILNFLDLLFWITIRS